MPDGADDALCVLVKRMAALERRLEDLEARPQRLRREDREAASVLLPAIARSVGAQSFTVAEVLALAALPEAEGMRAAIVTATGPVDRGTGRRTGKLLRRVASVDVNGLAVARIGVEADGAVWSVRKWVSVAAKPIAAIVAPRRAA